MDIGKAIKFMRKHRKLRQKHVAEACGISVNGVSQIELGNVYPHKETINKMAKFLRVPVSYLLYFSITDEDVPSDKVQYFKLLDSMMKTLMLDIIK